MLLEQKYLYLDLVRQAGSPLERSERPVQLEGKLGAATIALTLGRISSTAEVVRLREARIVQSWEMMLSVFRVVVLSRSPTCEAGGRRTHVYLIYLPR